MNTVTLTAEPRTTTGKRVKVLRSEGLVPAVVYGKSIAPVHIQVPERNLELALSEAGEASLVSLQIEGEDAARTVLVRDQQRDVLTHRIIHADFYEVVMTEKLRAHVPLVLDGRPSFLDEVDGVLLQMLEEVEVECLPGDLVPHITVDVSGLTSFDDAIYVKDLVPPPGIEVLADVDEMIAKVTPVAVPAAEEEEEAIPVMPEEVEVIRKGKAEAEAEEGEEE